MKPGAETRLAVYGSLAPGEVNDHQLAPLSGTWRVGTVRGTLHPTGWGMTYGFPALVPNPAGPAVRVQLFESGELPAHWARLDAFEGPAYRRVVVPVELADGTRTPANIYVANAEPTA